MQPSDKVTNQKDLQDFIQFIRPLIQVIDSIKREPFQLRSLSIPMRWEVTRRHPFYQRLWKHSADFHRKENTPTDPFEQLKQKSADELLSLIGVYGEPPDPRTPFSKLGESELNNAWLSGAVHPITLRGMAGLLLATLPKDTLGKLGLYLIEAGCDDSDFEESNRRKSSYKLQALECETLDSYPTEPLVSVNPAASQRQISEAIKNLHGQWKNERELKEQRDRSDKNKTYLEIWDLREGFSEEGAYDISEEQKISEIAEVVGSSISTVSNHYRSAFEMIIGKPYSPELWWNTIGVFKLSKFDLKHNILSQIRPRKSRTPRPVSESRLGLGIDSLKQTHVQKKHEYTLHDLIMDISSLIDQGLSDDEIQSNLEIKAKTSELTQLLTWMRSRTSEIEK
tara:strand:+ start:226 stop:1413 length:1188 start_codon:yes stop_codon:yes gene_type:complete